MDATDFKIQNLLTMHRGLYPKSSTLRLYEQWKKKKWGLVLEPKSRMTMEHSEHIRKIAPQDELLQECLGQVKIDSDEKREPTYTIKLLLRRCHQHRGREDIKICYQWLKRPLKGRSRGSDHGTTRTGPSSCDSIQWEILRSGWDSLQKHPYGLDVPKSRWEIFC